MQEIVYSALIPRFNNSTIRNSNSQFHLNRYVYYTTTAIYIGPNNRLVKVLLGIQQKFYQMSSRAIFLLLEVQQIFTPSKRCLVGSYFSATTHLVENFCQTSSTNSSTRCQVEQKIWAIEGTDACCQLCYKKTNWNIFDWSSHSY